MQLVFAKFPGGGSKLNVLQALAEFANEEGNCYVQIRRLAGAARLTRTQAQISMQWLRTHKWVISGKVRVIGSPLSYQINIPKLQRAERGDDAGLDNLTDAQRHAVLRGRRGARKNAAKPRKVRRPQPLSVDDPSDRQIVAADAMPSPADCSESLPNANRSLPTASDR